MTNDLAEVLERTTIEFPKAITGEEFQDMLRYLHQETGFEIRTNTKSYFNLRKPYKTEDQDSPIEEAYISEISGSIWSKEHLSFPTFIGSRDIRKAEYNQFSAFNFFVPPDWRVEDFRQEELETMDNIRGKIEQYFSQ